MPHKCFTESDVVRDGIFCSKDDLLYDPPSWMARGLQETATGYGRRLNSGYRIHYGGRFYRVYITCFSNAGTAWFQTKGRRIVVHS